MPWNDDAGPVPRRSDEDLLALTRAKAAALGEQRRRQAGVGLVAAAVLVVGLTAVLLRGGGDGGVEVRTASGGAADSTSVATAATAGPSGVTTTFAPEPLPLPTSTTRAATDGGTATPGVPPSTAPAADSSPGVTTTTPWVRCEWNDYSIRVSSDQPVYKPAERVRATIAVTNTSGRSCMTGPAGQSGVMWLDANGGNVGGAVTHADCGVADPCGLEFPAGTTQTSSWCWDQQPSYGVQAPPGTYTAELYWQGASGRATFEIVTTTSPSTASSPTPSPRAGTYAC